MPDSPSDQEILNISLSYAAYGGQRKAVDWLLELGADINARPRGFFRGRSSPRGGSTAIHKAVYADNGHMIRHLAKRGADLQLPAEGWGARPSEWAKHLDRSEAIRALDDLLQDGQNDSGGKE